MMKASLKGTKAAKKLPNGQRAKAALFQSKSFIKVLQFKLMVYEE